MDLKDLQDTWDELGKIDPLWAIASWPDKKGNKWNLSDFFAEGEKEIDGVIRYIDSLDLKVPRRKALDFGCGVGKVTQALAHHFDECLGVDIAPSMIALADQYNRHGEKCHYILNEVDNLRLFSNDDFDFVYTNFVLMHMQPKYALDYIREFLRVLNPQGLLMFDLLEQPAPLSQPTKPQPKEALKKRTKALLKRIAPKPVRSLYRRVRYGSQSSTEPRAEVYHSEREDVVSFLVKHGARVIDIRAEQRGSDAAFVYCVAKQ